jgi:hypothetical protein
MDTEDYILTKDDIRKFFLGTQIYKYCSIGKPVSELQLMSRLLTLNNKDAIFEHITLQDLIRLCGLKTEEEKMEIETNSNKYMLTRENRNRPYDFFTEDEEEMLNIPESNHQEIPLLDDDM